jgi:hypothetical protein
VVAGSLVGCSDKPRKGAGKDDDHDDHDDHPEPKLAYMLEGTDGKHACHGLNACKGKGHGGENECAGMSTCYTANKHECAHKNDCKAQGGCEEFPGANECKAHGECAVPLGDKAWKKARANFEKIYQEKNGKEPGADPGPKKDE